MFRKGDTHESPFLPTTFLSCDTPEEDIPVWLGWPSPQVKILEWFGINEGISEEEVYVGVTPEPKSYT